MIQRDADTRKLGKETRDMGYSLHNKIIIQRFYITLLRGRFLLLFFLERLITLIF